MSETENENQVEESTETTDEAPAAEAETRMGSGKGSPEHWVAVVKPGRVMFELAGVPEPLAKDALRLAGQKLSVKTKIVKREADLFEA